MSLEEPSSRVVGQILCEIIVRPEDWTMAGRTTASFNCAECDTLDYSVLLVALRSGNLALPTLRARSALGQELDVVCKSAGSQVTVSL